MSSGGVRFATAFERLCRADGGAPAVVDGATGERVSRDALARLTERAGAAVDRRPAGEQSSRDPLALFIPTSAELVAAVLACWQRDRVPLLIDAELAPAEASALARRLGLAAMLAGEALVWETTGEPAATPGPLPAGAAVLKVTSGSTGEARAVLVSGDGLARGVAQIASTMDIGATDSNLVPVPLTHSYGFDSAILTLAEFGCPIVLARGLPPGQLLAAGRAAGATVMLAVPVLLDVLSRSANAAIWPELRLVVSAGAPLGAETRERFAARFGVRPRNFYGSTECGGIAFDREGEGDLAEGCVGSALDGVTLELANPDTEGGADEGALEVGRVLVRSPSTALGYLPAPPAEAEAVIGDGSYLTSDLGRFDERGRLHLLGRIDDAVNVGGRKVFPAEVERVIRAVAGVRDVAVVGIERAGGTEALCAVVVADAEVDRARVIEACEAKLARHKVPRAVEFRTSLPRNARGKLDRDKLEV